MILRDIRQFFCIYSIRKNKPALVYCDNFYSLFNKKNLLPVVVRVLGVFLFETILKRLIKFINLHLKVTFLVYRNTRWKRYRILIKNSKK